MYDLGRWREGGKEGGREEAGGYGGHRYCASTALISKECEGHRLSHREKKVKRSREGERHPGYTTFSASNFVK